MVVGCYRGGDGKGGLNQKEKTSTWRKSGAGKRKEKPAGGFSPLKVAAEKRGAQCGGKNYMGNPHQ